MNYDDNNDNDMPMELTVEAYEQRMEDEEWADTVSDVFYMMSNDSRESATEAARSASITEAEWYFEQLVFDACQLWTTTEAACQADVDANFPIED